MNGNEASANKTVNITTNGITSIPVPANPTQKLVLVRVIVNTKGGTGANATIYDSNDTLGADGLLRKAILDTVNTLGNVEYGFPFFSGIYIVTGNGTPANLTIVYKETP